MSASLPPPAITPIYSTKVINQVIRLYEGPVEVITETGTWPGTGVIEQQWLPEPVVRLDCEYEAKESLSKPKAQVRIPKGSRAFDVTATSMGIGMGGGKTFATLNGLPDDMTWGTAEILSSVTFHIPNFSFFRGAPVEDPSTHERREARANISADGWTIMIDSLSEFSFEKIVALEDSSGSAITHVGAIKKTDGTPFSVLDGQDVLNELYLWLSFCRGNWVAPILSVGLDDQGKQVWGDWKQWNFRRSRRVRTWANRRNADFLERTLQGYFNRRKDSIWADAIKLALAWYIECNRRASGMEASIILGQTALELLAWTVLVEDKKVISHKGFMDLPAADKIRLLLANYQIPLEVPAYLVALMPLARAHNWADGPECLVGVRNALVHPEPKNRKKIQSISGSAFYEVLNLGLWYLDLIMLRLFDYTTLYSNRLKTDCYFDETLEKVPWAN